MGVLSLLASGTAFCPPYLYVCYSNTEKMEHDAGVEDIEKKKFYHHGKVWSGISPHSSSGSLLSNISEKMQLF